MTGIAVIMMILFLLIIWGGLVLSIYNFVIHPDEPEDEV
ncbi:MAG TPA: methionine/alanine import family NSS transporter small subunit [Dietzia timorensis]|uniref:Methionine/alanine import family NSS transporter small subunit n=1 Tax=Dietzia timorensis TaxID=499555 RepID=A0A921F6L8_9ACTN|nr:methionine/alanine import family NSS transporter small subunit [Dietzia timorensis]HJE91064.1 methionine/alanine import family NSS transporter small subunit [Dietzia timorensis]